RLVREFAAYIDVAGGRVHPDAGEEAAFDQLMRVEAQYVAILAGARLALVRVDDEIARPVAGLRHEGPFETGREAGAAAAAQARGLHVVDDPVAAFEDQLLGAVPIAARARTGKAPIARAVEIREDAILIGEHSLGPGQIRRGERLRPAFGRRALAADGRA